MNRTLAPQPSISSSLSVHRNLISNVYPNNNYWSIWILPIKLTNVMKAINPNTELNSIVLLLLYLSVTYFLFKFKNIFVFPARALIRNAMWFDPRINIKATKTGQK